MIIIATEFPFSYPLHAPWKAPGCFTARAGHANRHAGDGKRGTKKGRQE